MKNLEKVTNHINEFRSFMTNDKVFGFAVGVIVGNSVTSLIKNVVTSVRGLFHVLFIFIFNSHHSLKLDYLHLDVLFDSLITTLIVAGIVYFIINFMDNVWATKESEKFSYNTQIELLKSIDKTLKENKNESHN